MKKIFLLSSLFVIISSFGYTNEDFSNANYLGDQQIIVKQTTASKYRLDDKILRQEVIGMALKVKGITLPENYTCKKYFADATKNDWVCRAVELAADNGIITRSNKYANPGKSITRAEALAMVMSAGGLNPEDLPASGAIFTDATVRWQAEIIDAASKFGILNKDDYTTIIDNEIMNGERIVFSPNRLALRSEVFGFAKNVISLLMEDIYPFVNMQMWLNNQENQVFYSNTDIGIYADREYLFERVGKGNLSRTGADEEIAIYCEVPSQDRCGLISIFFNHVYTPTGNEEKVTINLGEYSYTIIYDKGLQIVDEIKFLGFAYSLPGV